MIKVVFFDVDGTLVSHTHTIVPESTRRAIKELQEKGVMCVIATGRHFLEMEQLLDKMEFPKPFTITRTFVGNPEQENGPPEVEFWPGSIATFKVRVLFRQNASWQGSVAWLDGKQEQGFRSALELFMLLDNALTSGQESCAS